VNYVEWSELNGRHRAGLSRCLQRQERPLVRPRQDVQADVPANPPAKQFWSLTVYDTYDRIGIDNKTQNADVSSRDDGLRKNADGSVDLYIGLNAPKGYEKNWLQTNPGKAWFAYFRLYGPLEPYLNRSWRLPDIELGG
jgi:hypothetical protein